MTNLLTILGMALGVYAVCLGGFALAEATLPRGFERALGFVPVAMLAALCATTLIVTPAELPIRLPAAISAGIVVWRTRKSWACILVGMALYWLLGRIF